MLKVVNKKRATRACNFCFGVGFLLVIITSCFVEGFVQSLSLFFWGLVIPVLTALLFFYIGFKIEGKIAEAEYEEE